MTKRTRLLLWLVGFLLLPLLAWLVTVALAEMLHPAPGRPGSTSST